MANVREAGERIVRLSSKHNVDPFVVLGLLAVHALADADFSKLEFWKDVSESLSEKAALAA